MQMVNGSVLTVQLKFTVLDTFKSTETLKSSYEDLNV